MEPLYTAKISLVVISISAIYVNGLNLTGYILAVEATSAYPTMDELIVFS